MTAELGRDCYVNMMQKNGDCAVDGLVSGWRDEVMSSAALPRWRR